MQFFMFFTACGCRSTRLLQRLSSVLVQVLQGTFVPSSGHWEIMSCGSSSLSYLSNHCTVSTSSSRRISQESRSVSGCGSTRSWSSSRNTCCRSGTRSETLIMSLMFYFSEFKQVFLKKKKKKLVAPQGCFKSVFTNPNPTKVKGIVWLFGKYT